MPSPFTATSDSDLLHRFADSGDESAFRALVDRYGGLVRGVARRRTGDPALADEVAQNVFLSASRKAAKLADGRPLAGWLHRATLLESLKALRQRATYQRSLERYGAERDIESESSGADVWSHLRPHIDAALDRLPRLDRDVLLLHFLEEKPFREVAAAIGTSPEAAQKRGARAVAKLSRRLAAKGVSLSTASLVAALGPGLVEGAPPAWKASVTTAASGAGTTTTVSALAGTTVACGLFAASAAVPIALEIANEPGSAATAVAPPTVPGTATPSASAPARQPFDIGLVRDALEHLQSTEDPDITAERALRRFIFGLDLAEVQAVADLLHDTASNDRLFEIGQDTYARWAELDPTGATNAANGLAPGLLGYYPLQGAFQTWAAIDRDAALGWLASAESAYDLRFLAYPLIDSAEKTDPIDALEVADRIGTDRPNWFDELLKRSSRHWITREPDAALAHLATLPDLVQRDELIVSGLDALGERDPVAALERVDILTNPPQRETARYDIYWNWATRDPLRAFAYFAHEERLATWSASLLRTAAEAVSREDPAAALAVVGRITDPGRLDSLLGGILAGSTWSDPAAAVLAADLISDQASYQNGDVRQFVEAWARVAPDAARSWVEALPESHKKRFAASGLAPQP